MSFSFLSPEQMSNIGGWMVFLAAIFLLILIPLTIVEIVAQKRLEKRCTAIANGTYAGTKVNQRLWSSIRFDTMRTARNLSRAQD